MTTRNTPVRPTNLDFGPAYAAQEQAAPAALVALGITLDPNPVPRGDGSHTMCAFHLFDASGEELDGGQASSLLGWVRDGHITGATVIRPVAA